MYTLYDKFNHRAISAHRTVSAAAKAEARLFRRERIDQSGRKWIAILNQSGDDVRSDEGNWMLPVRSDI